MRPELITTSIITPTTANGLCSCIFDLEDEYGKYRGRKPHTDWSIYKQEHSNPGFRYYIECNKCHYQFAMKYWETDHSIEGGCNHLAEYMNAKPEPTISYETAYLPPKDVIKALAYMWMNYKGGEFTKSIIERDWDYDSYGREKFRQFQKNPIEFVAQADTHRLDNSANEVVKISENKKV